jgi:hypothetical protein
MPLGHGLGRGETLGRIGKYMGNNAQQNKKGNDQRLHKH